VPGDARAAWLTRPEITAQLLRAYALYTLTSLSPLKPVFPLTQAGRPDLAVAYAAAALGFRYASPAVVYAAAKDSAAAAGAWISPLPAVVLTTALSPADRTRVANLLIQCQALAWPGDGTSDGDNYWDDEHQHHRFPPHGPVWSFAMPPADFGRFLATNRDYTVDRAIAWLAANGLVLQALIVGHERDPIVIAAAAKLAQANLKAKAAAAPETPLGSELLAALSGTATAPSAAAEHASNQSSPPWYAVTAAAAREAGHGSVMSSALTSLINCGGALLVENKRCLTYLAQRYVCAPFRIMRPLTRSSYHLQRIFAVDVQQSRWGVSFHAVG
jgi:hypothetical protein